MKKKNTQFVIAKLLSLAFIVQLISYDMEATTQNRKIVPDRI